MAKQYTLTDLVQNTVWGVEHAARKAQRAQDEKEARNHLRTLRKQVDELERRVVAMLAERARLAAEARGSQAGAPDGEVG